MLNGMLKFEQVISFELNGPDPWLLVRGTQGSSGGGHSRVYFSISYQTASPYRTGSLENSKIWLLLIAVTAIAAERWMVDFMAFCCLYFKMIAPLCGSNFKNYC